jgi:hypothetical protein
VRLNWRAFAVIFSALSSNRVIFSPRSNVASTDQNQHHHHQQHHHHHHPYPYPYPHDHDHDDRLNYCDVLHIATLAVVK